MILLFKNDIGTKKDQRVCFKCQFNREMFFVKLYIETLIHKEKNMCDKCRPVRKRDGKRLLYLKTSLRMLMMIEAV